MQETRLRFLGREEPLEKEMETYSSILAKRIPMNRGSWQATVHGITRVRLDLVTKPPQTFTLEFDQKETTGKILKQKFLLLVDIFKLKSIRSKLLIVAALILKMPSYDYTYFIRC